MEYKRKQSDSNFESPKKSQRKQSYLSSYTEKYAFIVRGSTDSKVKCTVCDSQFTISAGGMNDIKRHVQGPQHIKNSEELENNNK